MEKGNKQALFEHIQFCERKMRKTAVKYPWELSSIQKASVENDLLTPRWGPFGMAPLVKLSPEVSEPQELSTARHCSSLLNKQPLVAWESKLDAHREAAVVKWHKIIMIDPMSFEVGRSFFTSMKRGLNSGRLLDDLQNVLSAKSSATLHNRSGPMLRYIAFCNQNKTEAFPLFEEQVYNYIQCVEQSASPTYLRSLLSSIGFCYHVLGLSSGKAVVESSRTRGLAVKCFLHKRKTQDRLPLTVSEVMALEDIVLGHTDKSVVDRRVAGCFLFMIFGRARYSDMMNVSKLQFDYVEDNGSFKGYVETEVARSKTSLSLDRKVRLLPMTATIQGLLPEPWGIAWQKVVEESGVQIGPGRPLLPSRTHTHFHCLPNQLPHG